jgi:hypothetical protein
MPEKFSPAKFRRGLPGSHESGHPLMKVRRSRIKGPIEIVAVGVQHATKIQNLIIKDGLLSAFNFGERAAADFQTCKLKLNRKPFLRPPAFVAQPPNLRSYNIAVHRPARATQAQIAKGQLALTLVCVELATTCDETALLPRSNRAFNLRLRAACRVIGVGEITAHGLRHSAATILLNQVGKDLREI